MGKGCSDNQDPPSPVTSSSQLKEKGCNNQDPQSPVASGSQSKGRAPGAPAYTPGERKAIPAPPKKKTPAEKRRAREEAEEAYEASCPDVLFDDLERDAAEHQAQRLLGLPAWQGADDLATTPSISTSAGLPRSSRGVSPDQLLQPPTCTDTSSSVSSWGSKRQHEPSPASQSRRPSYRPSQRDLWAPSRRSPSWCPPEHFQQSSSYDTNIMVELQTRLPPAIQRPGLCCGL
jgi:hypothetical protein